MAKGKTLAINLYVPGLPKVHKGIVVFIDMQNRNKTIFAIFLSYKKKDRTIQNKVKTLYTKDRKVVNVGLICI